MSHDLVCIDWFCQHISLSRSHRIKAELLQYFAQKHVSQKLHVQTGYCSHGEMTRLHSYFNEDNASYSLKNASEMCSFSSIAMWRIWSCDDMNFCQSTKHKFLSRLLLVYTYTGKTRIAVGEKHLSASWGPKWGPPHPYTTTLSYWRV